MPDFRAKALALLSAFVSGALLGAFPLLAIQSWRGQWPPLETRDVISGLVFVGLALVTVVIVLRGVFRRQRRGFIDTSRLKDGAEVHGVAHLEGQPELVGLARACGLVAVAGLAAGGWAGWGIFESRLAGLEAEAEGWCEASSSLGFSEVTACAEAARRCLREGWAASEGTLARVGPLSEFVSARLREAVAAERQRPDDVTAVPLRDWGRLANWLKDSVESPRVAQSRQAALVCLADAGGLRF
jgi:hypothetical protein